MTSPTPIIPAEAGTQCFGTKNGLLVFLNNSSFLQMAQGWVPASAGMIGQEV